MDTQTLRRFAYLTVSLFGAAALLYVGVRYALPLLSPFLVAWGVVMCMRPVGRFLQKYTHAPARLCRVIASILFLLLLIGGVLSLGTLLGVQGWRFLSGLASQERLSSIVSFLLNPFGGVLSHIEGAQALEQRLAEAINQALSSLVGMLASIVPGIVAAVPRIFLFLVVAVISTVYIAWDLDRIHATVLSLLPKRMRTRVCTFKDRFLCGVWPYVRSYLILMLLTFVIMTVGLSILRVEYALLLAVIIALLDPLPVIGVGTVLIPWSLFQLFFGSTPFGIGLLVLYVVHEIFRQIAEPRILGRSMGLHPLLTLVLLYVGYSVLGITGLLLLPLATVTLHVLLTARRRRTGDEKTVTHEGTDPPTGT